MYDNQSNPIICSDWELNVQNNIQGKKTSISNQQNPALFPCFFNNKESYFKRSAELGQNMFRLSFDFARLCPKPFEFNTSLMRDYLLAILEIKHHHQEPIITLYHWPMPLYLLEMSPDGSVLKGGWEHPDVLEHFKFYVEQVTKSLCDQELILSVLNEHNFTEEFKTTIINQPICSYFITINEPNSILFPGYVDGSFPPYKKLRFDLMPKVLKNLVAAHDIAFRLIKDHFKNHKTFVGIAHSWPYFDGILGSIGHALINTYVTKRFERDGTHTDFLGIQYYFRMTISPFSRKFSKLYGNHPGFGDIYPRGILRNLKYLNFQYPTKDILITEFGFSEHSDLQKPFLILETLKFIIQAIQEKIPVRAILIWTLVDNLEWSIGMDARFGFWKESDLKTDLPNRTPGLIRGFEAWKSAVTAILHPTREHLADLQSDYESARTQFKKTFLC